MKIFNLNNKLLQIRHKITKQQFQAVKQKTGLSQEDLVNNVKADLIQQLTPAVMKAFQIEMTDDIADWSFGGRGYVLSEVDMINVLLEVAELDTIGRDNLILSCRKWLGMQEE